MNRKTKQVGWARFALAALLVVASLYNAKPSLAISGSRWLKLNRDERIAYISGVLDTWDDDVALCEKKT